MNDGSISDLYYHEESKTVKNHKHEVIVYFDDHWNVLEEHLAKTYCKEVSDAIKATFSGSSDDVENLIIVAKKRISKIKKQKMQNDGLLKDAAIALDLSPDCLNPIQSKISKFFKSHNIHYERIKNPHVSTAYLLGYNRYSDLAELVKTIANYNFDFKVIGLELLAGTTTNKDYLVLKVEAPESFYKALHYIEQESDTMKFPGGFKTHISLYSVHKGSINSSILIELKAMIEEQKFTLNHQITLKPEAVSVFNNSRLLELRQKLKNTIIDKIKD